LETSDLAILRNEKILSLARDCAHCMDAVMIKLFAKQGKREATVRVLDV
jgi:hypothetical protein